MHATVTVLFRLYIKRERNGQARKEFMQKNNKKALKGESTKFYHRDRYNAHQIATLYNGTRFNFH